MTDALFLGFDGGATKTAATAINSEKEIIAEAVGQPANFQVIGVEKACQNLLEIAELLLKEADASLSQVKSIYLGLAGAGRIEDADKLRSGFIDLLTNKISPPPVVHVGSDAIAALEGAFCGKPGMILISGTGSILFAKDSAEKIHRVGGWGRFIGDEGSGYAIGRACLSAIAREFDGRGKPTLITQLLKSNANIHDAESLVRRVYQESFDIASAATIAITAAENGDEVAIGIVDDAVKALTEHISAMLGRIDGHLLLVLSGSLLINENLLSSRLRQSIADNFPDLDIVQPKFSASVGAAFLALKLSKEQ